MPENEDLLNLRDDRENFAWMIDNIGMHMITPMKDFYKKLPVKKISDILTASDEAFCLLVMENYRNVIEEQANKPLTQRLNRGQRRKDINEVPKYTAKGIGARKNEGWNTEGLERFIEMVKIVKKNREEDSKLGDESTEEWYLRKTQAERVAKMEMKRGLKESEKESKECQKRKKLENPIE